MYNKSLYYFTPLVWALFLLLRWVAFYLYPSDLGIQKMAGVYLGVLLVIPYVLYIVCAIRHIRHFRQERVHLLISTIYIVVFSCVVG